MANVPLITIQRMAGHKHITTTERYLHIVAGAQEDAIEALSKKRMKALSVEK